MKLKHRLMFSFLMVLIIPSLVIGFTSYQAAQSTLGNQMMDNAMESTDIVSQKVNEIISSKMNEADFLSKLIHKELYEGWESPRVREILDGYVQNHPELDFAYLGTEVAGDMIREPNPGPESEGFDPRTRPWYVGAMEDPNSVSITDPYVAISTGSMVVTISKALTDFSGVVGLQMDLTEFQGIISNITIGEEGFVYILDENNVPVVHPELEIGEQMEVEWGTYIASNDSGMFDYENMNGQEMRSTFVTNDLTGWTIGSTVSAEEIKRSSSPIFNFTILVIVISVIVGIIIVYFVIRSIVRPLEHLKLVTEKVSNGDLTEQVIINSDDEIGSLGKTFNTMTSSLREIVGKVRNASNEMAATSKQLATSSEEVTVGVEEISKNTQQVASDAEGGNHATVEAAKVLLELSSLIQIAKEKSISATRSSMITLETASEGRATVNETVVRMESIKEKTIETEAMIATLDQYSKEIGVITDTITQIADQTNLLALNAAIEAARAGEAGKGFAVVADEVRKLAEQSNKGANQVSLLINKVLESTRGAVQVTQQSRLEVEAGVDSVTNSGAVLQNILEAVGKTVSDIEEIGNITDSEVGTSDKIVELINTLASIIENTAANAEEVAASTQEATASMQTVAASAEETSKLASDLKQTVDVFKV